MKTNAAEMMLQSVFNGSLSMNEMEVERRPYHKNCGCALHKLKRGGGSSTPCTQQRMVSFTKRPSWTDCCLSMIASKSSTQYSVLGEHSNGIETEKM